MKNLPQPYQSCSRRLSDSSGQQDKWSFCWLHLLYLREETAVGGALPETEQQVSIYCSSFPHFLWNRACPQSQAPSSFPFANSLSTLSVHLFIPPKTVKPCTGYGISQVFLREDMLPYHLMFMNLCNWTENTQIILLANVKYGTTKRSANNSSAPGCRFDKTVDYYTLGLYRHKEERCSEVWVILQHREMNVCLWQKAQMTENKRWID